MRNIRPLQTAINLQALLYRKAQEKETTASALAQVSRAWSELEERKRILRMKPKPKDIDTTKEPKPNRAQVFSPSFLEDQTEKESLKLADPSPPPPPGEDRMEGGVR